MNWRNNQRRNIIISSFYQDAVRYESLVKSLLQSDPELVHLYNQACDIVKMFRTMKDDSEKELEQSKVITRDSCLPGIPVIWQGRLKSNIKSRAFYEHGDWYCKIYDSSAPVKISDLKRRVL